MLSRLRHWAPRLTAWLLVPALGVALRMIPAWTSPTNTWVADGAFHYRLVASLVDHGRLPDPDSLSDLPAGRRLGRFLPLGLYPTAAAWHRVASRFGDDLPWSLAWFTAIAGALVAWPVWIGARALGAGPWGAALAALIAVLLPAHLQRTTAYMLRYDALGVLLIASHMMLGLAALSATERRAAILRSAGSGAALIAALAVWRVPLVVPALEAAAVAVIAIARPPSERLRVWAGVTAIGLVLSCMAFEYLRAQGHAWSLTATAVIAIAVGLQTPFVARPASHAISRVLVLLIAGAAAVAVSAWLGRRGDFEALGSLLRLRLLGGVATAAATDPVTAVLLSVKELGPMPLRELWGASGFSWLCLWLVAAPFALWLNSGYSPRAWAGSAGEPVWVLLGSSGALLMLSLLAMRHRILLAPAIAVLAGTCVSSLTRGRVEVAAEPAPSVARKGGRRPARRDGAAGRSSRDRVIQRVALVALIPCMVVLARDARSAAMKSITGLDLGMSASIAWLREHGVRGPVLSFWDRGYELQRYAGCPTLTDGMLESEVNQAHIVSTARALLAATPDSLDAICERFDVEYVVVPPQWYLRGVVMAAGDPLADKMAAHVPLNREEIDRVVFRMALAGKPEPPFEPVFERGHYRIYHRQPRALRTATP